MSPSWKETPVASYQRQYQMSQVLHIELDQCRLHTAQLCLCFVVLALAWVPTSLTPSTREAPKVPLMRGSKVLPSPVLASHCTVMSKDSIDSHSLVSVIKWLWFYFHKPVPISFPAKFKTTFPGGENTGLGLC